MGYCYTKSGSLVCDSCGSPDAKKITCPHKVYYCDGSSLPYCPAPALCPACLKKHGGRAKIHAACKAPAAARTLEETRIGERLRAGELQRGTAWGDWHKDVPAGMVGVRFFNPITGESQYKLIPQDTYNAHQWLNEYPPLDEWANHPDATTKRIA